MANPKQTNVSYAVAYEESTKKDRNNVRIVYGKTEYWNLAKESLGAHSINECDNF